MRTTVLLPLLPLLVLLGACGGNGSDAAANSDPRPTTEPTVAIGGLTETGGCGTALFYAGNDDDSTLLMVNATELFTERTAGPSEITLPSRAVSVTLEEGNDLYACTDIASVATRVDATATATSGTVTITLEFPPGWDETSIEWVPASIALDDVEFDNGARVEHQEWSTEVGWYPG